jgi:long-chain acyl-CoA synthetase
VSDRVSWFWDEMKDESASEAPHETSDLNEPAYILATGGTTGDPKAVTLSHRNLVSNAWQQYYWAGGVIGRESILAVLPFFHSYGLSATIMSGAACVASLYMDHRFNVRQVIRPIENHGPTIFHAVPAMLVALNRHLRKHPADLSSIKWVMSGGASLPVNVAKEFATHTGGLVVEGYVLSEASRVTHAGPLNVPSENGTIGLPMPDTECRIVCSEDETTEVAEGETGELLIKGPQVMLGYWKNEAATAKAIRDGWLYTGDLAKKLPDGFYRIVERKKDLIITSGFNVYPQEVEEALLTCPGVTEVAVVGLPDEERGEMVKAYFVMKSKKQWKPDDINAWCLENLAAQKRPRAIEHCPDSLPRNFLG